MVTIYGIKNCNTMKKAFDKLDQLGVSYQFHDYKKENISAEKLKQWIDELGIEKVVNKQGMTWRKLDEATQSAAMNPSTANKVLQENTSIIKRPNLETGKNNILGYDEAQYESLK